MNLSLLKHLIAAYMPWLLGRYWEEEEMAFGGNDIRM